MLKVTVPLELLHRYMVVTASPRAAALVNMDWTDAVNVVLLIAMTFP
jgi:hypothetical protein